MAVNPLANPKGVKLLCELCQKPAFIQCTKCRVTYYCGAEHQNIDRIGIHEKICQLLIPLRTPIPITSGSQEEREHRKQQQLCRLMQMIELTQTAGQRLLFEGKYEYAIPAALQSLKFSIDVYGTASIELVPAYLILGEACIGLNRLSQAEEYLSQAQWTVLKTSSCNNAFKSRLFRNLGLLNATLGNYQESLRHLADDIYHSSCEFGTDDIRTAGGYFHMAHVFYQQNKLDVAFSLYSQVTEIWYNHLDELVEQRLTPPPKATGIGPAQIVSNDKEYDSLDEAQEAEAKQVLGAILQLRENQAIKSPAIMVKILYTVAMLHFVLGDITKAKEYATSALQTGQKRTSSDDRVVRKVENFLAAIGTY